MRPTAIPMLALLLTGCASGVWNARVYSCEEITSVEIVDGLLQIDADRQECYVQVRNLDEHAIFDGRLTGGEVEVFTNAALPYDVTDTEIDHVAGGLTVKGPPGDYRWDPETERLDATDTDPDGTLRVVGSLKELVLDGAGPVNLQPGLGFLGVDGDAAELVFGTRFSFDHVDVTLTGDASLTLPRAEVYFLDIDAKGTFTTDPDVRAGLVDTTASVIVRADGDVTLTDGPGGNEPFPQRTRNVGVQCRDNDEIAFAFLDTSFEGTSAWLEMLNPEGVYESHRLYPTTGAPPLTHFASELFVGEDTALRCGLPGVDFGEVIPTDLQMTYLARVFAGGTQVECFAIGLNPAGIIERGHLATFRSETIDPNLCDASYYLGATPVRAHGTRE